MAGTDKATTTGFCRKAATRALNVAFALEKKRHIFHSIYNTVEQIDTHIVYCDLMSHFIRFLIGLTLGQLSTYYLKFIFSCDIR